MEQNTATLKFLRMAPRKVRSVGDLIKGLSVNEAEAQLIVQSRRPAKPLLKLLRSAVANAKNNKQIDPAYLVVANVRVDGGPMLKRYLPRARGSASPIQKKMSHVTITLAVNEKLKNRFTIVVPKKTKATPTGDRPTKVKKTKDTEEEKGGEPKKNNPGFFKRTFNRKSGDGK